MTGKQDSQGFSLVSDSDIVGVDRNSDYEIKQALPLGPTKLLKKLSSQGQTILHSIACEDIRLQYTFIRRLGSGSFGTVRIAHKTSNPEMKFAVKSIKREQILTSKSEQELIQELLILRAVDHPNIIKLNEVYLDNQYLHIVTELMEGGEVDPKN